MKNVIVLLIDALRYDHVTPKITPNLIKISQDGLFYKNCLAGNTHTTKSIPIMLNGSEEYQPENSIMAILKEYGYTNYCIHSNVLLGQMFSVGGWDHEIDMVMDRFRKESRMRKLVNKLPSPIFEIVRRFYRKSVDPKDYYPYSRASKILPYVSDLLPPIELPYFLWIHLMDPHIPYYPTKTHYIPHEQLIKTNDRLRDAVRNRYVPVPNDITLWKYLYRKEVTEMDATIGKFYEGIDWSDKVLIITSDHGDEFGEHGGFSHTVDKFIPQLQHVPLIVVGGGKGAVEDTFSHYDLRSMILKLVEVRYCENCGEELKYLVCEDACYCPNCQLDGGVCE